MRKPREPRAPREPSGASASAEPPAGAIPPPGFSVPIRGFHYGASGGGPQPPRRFAAPTPPAAYAAPAAAAVPPALVEPEVLPPEPPAGPAIAAASTNAYAEQAQGRAYWQARSTRTPQPQGETQLVHAWLHVLTVRKIPPHACTIWLTRVEPQPTYEQFIIGDAVLGEHPDRALYEFVSANRRQRDVAERFVGRIRAPAADGSPIELGGGELYLPPAPAAASLPPWSQPGAGAPPWASPSPYGMPPPWGAPPMPWWMGGGMGSLGGPPGGMPPWWGPSTPPLSALMAASQPPPAPAAVQQDPAALKAWQMMSDNQSMLLRHVLEVSARPAPVAAVAEQPDMWTTLERVVNLTEKLRGPPEKAERPHVNVIKVDDDTTLVTNKHGDIDAGATAWANMKGVKGIVQSLRAMKTATPGGAAGGGPQPPRALNGGAKPNGAAS